MRTSVLCSVINTQFVKCVVCIIMVQLETAQGNNSVPSCTPRLFSTMPCFCSSEVRLVYPMYNRAGGIQQQGRGGADGGRA